MANEVSTEVKGTEQFLPSLFKDIDFKSLNGSIDSLAKAGEQLDEGQRENAVAIVNEWERNVISRLNNHGEEIHDFIDFLDGRKGGRSDYGGSDCFARFGELRLKSLAESTQTSEKFEALVKARENYDLVISEQPDRSDYEGDPDMTYADQALRHSDFEKQLTIWKLNKTRAMRAESKAEKEWKIELNKNTDIKETIGKAKKYNATLSRFTNECRSKSQMAKLNISIGNSEVRKSLMELLSFSEKI